MGGGKSSHASARIWTHSFVSAEFNRVLIGLMHAEMEHAFFRHKINLRMSRYRTQNAYENSENPAFLRRRDRLDNGRKPVAAMHNLNVFALLWNLHKV